MNQTKKASELTDLELAEQLGVWQDNLQTAVNSVSTLKNELISRKQKLQTLKQQDATPETVAETNEQ